MGDFLTTKRMPWAVHRLGVQEGSEDTDLAAATKSWASVTANFPVNDGKTEGLYLLSERHNGILLRFRCNDSADDTFTAKLYLFREFDDAKKVCDIAGTIGLMQASKQIDSETTLYADTLVISNNSFPNPASSDSPTGADEMALITLDTTGFKYALVLVDSMTLTGADTKKVAVDITGW